VARGSGGGAPWGAGRCRKGLVVGNGCLFLFVYLGACLVYMD
jgi:hypothetical protein